jgi:hypothetical protein
LQNSQHFSKNHRGSGQFSTAMDISALESNRNENLLAEFKMKEKT